MSQVEKQRYQFWCKNGGKMVHYAWLMRMPRVETIAQFCA